MSTPKQRAMVIGLDCATPQFVFGPKAFDMPNMRRLMERGAWGPLRSSDPPITVPAWACMMSGRDPGALGIYGFRNRKDHSYDGMFTANANAIKVPRLWDILSRAGKKVVVLGVPQTYPVKPVNGWLVADFLAPNTDADYTYPKALKQELETACGGEYLLDVKDFRTDDKEGLLHRVFGLMENRFTAARHLMTTKQWDFFMMVEMGLDRLHHGFWRFCDTEHPLFEPGNRYEHLFRDFYQALDKHIGEMIALAGEETAVFIVSDHGARGMHGGVCVNEWLIQEGLLVLKDGPPATPMRIEDCAIDWTRTKAWSSGGYYARVFLNVEGREEQGIIPAGEYASFRADLAERIRKMPAPDGQPLGNIAHTPEDLYPEVNGVAPDLIVYFGGLGWRSVGQVGTGSIYTFENDTGPDDANHDTHGVLIMDAGQAASGRIADANLLDIAPSILDLYGLEIPAAMLGRSLMRNA